MPLGNAKGSAGDILIKAGETYNLRNKTYGSNYLKVGEAMKALFPNGVKLENEFDFRRFHLLELVIVKLTRYCHNFNVGGHQDSIHDASVYAAMVEQADSEYVQYLDSLSQDDLTGEQAEILVLHHEEIERMKKVNAAYVDVNREVVVEITDNVPFVDFAKERYEEVTRTSSGALKRADSFPDLTAFKGKSTETILPRNKGSQSPHGEGEEQ